MSEKDVKMGEYEIASGSDVLKALGIGSCVAVCLYTDRNDFGAMAHVMLPAEEGEASNKHADILIYQMLEEIEQFEDVSKCSLNAKIFGGALMFEESTSEIGQEIVRSVKNILDEENIDITEEDTGGNKGRAIWFNTKSKDVAVRRTGEGTKRY